MHPLACQTCTVLCDNGKKFSDVMGMRQHALIHFDQDNRILKSYFGEKSPEMMKGIPDFERTLERCFPTFSTDLAAREIHKTGSEEEKPNLKGKDDVVFDGTLMQLGKSTCSKLFAAPNLEGFGRETIEESADYSNLKMKRKGGCSNGPENELAAANRCLGMSSSIVKAPSVIAQDFESVFEGSLMKLEKRASSSKQFGAPNLENSGSETIVALLKEKCAEYPNLKMKRKSGSSNGPENELEAVNSCWEKSSFVKVPTTVQRLCQGAKIPELKNKNGEGEVRISLVANPAIKRKISDGNSAETRWKNSLEKSPDEGRGTGNGAKSSFEPLIPNLAVKKEPVDMRGVKVEMKIPELKNKIGEGEERISLVAHPAKKRKISDGNSAEIHGKGSLEKQPEEGTGSGANPSSKVSGIENCCAVCLKVFHPSKRNGHVYWHLKEDDNRSRYNCKICWSRAANLSGIKRHFPNKHPKEYAENHDKADWYDHTEELNASGEFGAKAKLCFPIWAQSLDLILPLVKVKLEN